MVFCGSSSGKHESYHQAAYELGKTLAARNIELTYGGANIGLMGAVANGTLDNNGKVTGVLPHFLAKKEIAHQGLTKLILVDTMHERKTIMSDLADGIIALPGGIGTMEELFEVFTWAQLGLHTKPIGILNVNGFYDALVSFIQDMIQNGFLKPQDQNRLIVESNMEKLLDKMRAYEAPEVDKLISRETT